jgi:anti-anti-sigma regulatory factor
MFSSRPPRNAADPGPFALREQRLGGAVRLFEVSGALEPDAAGELTRRIGAAQDAGARWVVVDVAGAAVAEGVLAALAGAARAVRSRKGELIVTGAPAEVARALADVPAGQAPLQAAGVDEAIMILKAGPRQPRAKQRIAALMLPRLEPPA